ncbi:hypothetical protein K4F52_005564 [Lecanicillium sp. MT-2017a]|nr:hypothetical protein K4F52_005564 [Lecanicillium sp. MT-2017a]
MAFKWATIGSVNRPSAAPVAAGKGKRRGSSLSSESRDEEAERNRKSRLRIRKVAIHFKRYLICYLLAGFIFLAIFLPILFLVIFPAIAQKLVNDYDIPIYSIGITNPTLDSVTLSLNTALSVPLGLSVRLDPFNLTLFDRDFTPEQPYIIAPVDGYTVKKHTNITVAPQALQILDVKQFTHVLSKAALQKTVRLSVKGKTTAHLGALKASISLNKDVELNGLDKLRGFSLDSANIAFNSSNDNQNLEGLATLPNHSVGNMTLNVLAGDFNVGQGMLDNVVLNPGNNTVPIRGNLDIESVLENLGALMDSQSEAMSRGNVAISASGNSTVYNGVHIPYLEEVLNNLTLTAEVPILGIVAGSMGDFLASHDDLIKNITQRLNITSPLR